jgi:hypothetical protein
MGVMWTLCGFRRKNIRRGEEENLERLLYYILDGSLC